MQDLLTSDATGLQRAPSLPPSTSQLLFLSVLTLASPLVTQDPQGRGLRRLAPTGPAEHPATWQGWRGLFAGNRLNGPGRWGLQTGVHYKGSCFSLKIPVSSQSKQKCFSNPECSSTPSVHRAPQGMWAPQLENVVLGLQGPGGGLI